ncbi:hypothetical protein SCB71_10555 [Herbiconiux sp. KACC 21604]|uniref:hypothetical protein n=1 Tax=unclassified Herbiconiux TaxID=2618217 RepID=UPI001492391E|nr:hypothetical protein [Herbiconiux sp. SALV-R1]QJU53670.1 hypothetical protein HL652_08505 [Herbiconiux sp. SALV-R1]WPO84673.1 hypothetical protein SCB71_10555 [Herbiconiux sp. KACC 21604]
MRSESGPVVAGYRLIELLAVGERANVFLARRVGGAGAREEGEEVVLKVRLVRGRHAEGAGEVEVLEGWREPELELEPGPGPGGSADRAARVTGRESEEDERVTGSHPPEWWTWEQEATGPDDDRRELSVAEAIDPALEAVVELVRVVRRRLRGSRRALLATPRRKILAGGVVAAVVVVAAVCGAMPGGDAAGSGPPRADASASAFAPAAASESAPAAASASALAAAHVSSPPTGTASAVSASAGEPVEAATRDVERRGARLEGARVVEELGGAVVVGGTVVAGAPGEETTKPVSLLVVRSETGWVVRAVDAWRDDPG